MSETKETRGAAGRLGRNPFEQKTKRATPKPRAAKKVTSLETEAEVKLASAPEPTFTPEPAYAQTEKRAEELSVARETCVGRAARWLTVELPAEGIVLGLKTLLVVGSAVGSAIDSARERRRTPSS
jgi:hypothetical protein